uniref:Nonstructural protein 1 n=1 Tax=Duck-associated chapparvovirus 1 TaxID=2810802 RepID=A0A891F054_9VIRU|nr:nonstructural protein 1 [Duck-associated chapparvovirus 1]
MSAQVRCSRQGVRRLLWRGIRGESIGTCLESASQEGSEIMQDKEHVARPMPVIEVEQKLMNMRTYIGGVIMLTDGDGNVIEDVVIYANLLNNMHCNEDWLIIGEENKDRIFHVHTLARTGVRTDSYRRTQESIWSTIKTHPIMIAQYGSATCDMLKCQKAHKPWALMEYMCKNPIWICSNSDALLQATYDIDTWNMCARFRGTEEIKPDIDKANPMIQEMLQIIMEHNCKSLEDVCKKAPDVVVKHLHKPGFASIVANCLTYSKCTGRVWKLSQYGSVVSDPSYIHCILLHQGINPTDFDYIFWQWITKRHAKRNTIHIFGPSNTGKSSLFVGLGKCCPGGEIVNGNNFNFEGLIEQYWGKWEEPLCSPEIAEKCKQIFEGMECAIQVKFKKPYMLPRTPIIITTNSMIWHWCQNQEGPFRNRMWFFDFEYDMSDGIFVPRCIESSCKCRSCCISRGGTPSACSSTTSGLQRTKQSSQKQLATGNASTESTMGDRSMSERAGTSRQSDETECSGRESSSYATARGCTSTTTSGGNGSSGEHGSSSTTVGICSSSTGSSEQLEPDTTGGCTRRNPHGIQRGGGAMGRGDGRRYSRYDEVFPTMVSMGGARPKKPKMAVSVQSSEQRLGGKMDTMKIPDKAEWAAYLSYIYHRYENAVEKPDLFAYEELDEEVSE